MIIVESPVRGYITDIALLATVTTPKAVMDIFGFLGGISSDIQTITIYLVFATALVRFAKNFKKAKS